MKIDINASTSAFIFTKGLASFPEQKYSAISSITVIDWSLVLQLMQFDARFCQFENLIHYSIEAH